MMNKFKKIITLTMAVAITSTSVFPTTALAADTHDVVAETEVVQEASESVSEVVDKVDEAIDSIPTYEVPTTEPKEEEVEVVAEEKTEDELLVATVEQPERHTQLLLMSETEISDFKGAVKVEHNENVYVLSFEDAETCMKAYTDFTAGGFSVEYNDVVETYDETTEEVVDTTDVTSIEETDVVTDETTTEEVVEDVTTEEEKVDVTKQRQIKVAVIDTGVDINNELLKGHLVEGLSSDMTDTNGHGTLMAEIIASNTNENVKILPISAFDENGKGTVGSTYYAIKKAISEECDVISLSISGLGTSKMLTSVIAEAKEKGIYVVVASGNDGKDADDYMPGNILDAITISAVETDENGEKILASYSNYGECVDYSALGTIVKDKGTKDSSDDEVFTGTSISAANVSSYIATMLQYIKNDDTTENDEVLDALNETVEDLGEAGRDDSFGVGYLSLDKLNKYLESKTPITEEDTNEKEEKSDESTENTTNENTEIELEEADEELDEEDLSQELETSYTHDDYKYTVSAITDGAGKVTGLTASVGNNDTGFEHITAAGGETWVFYDSTHYYGIDTDGKPYHWPTSCEAYGGVYNEKGEFVRYKTVFEFWEANNINANDYLFKTSQITDITIDASIKWGKSYNCNMHKPYGCTIHWNGHHINMQGYHLGSTGDISYEKFGGCYNGQFCSYSGTATVDSGSWNVRMNGNEGATAIYIASGAGMAIRGFDIYPGSTSKNGVTNEGILRMWDCVLHDCTDGAYSSGTLDLHDCTITNCGRHGVSCKGGSANLYNLNISYTGSHGVNLYNKVTGYLRNSNIAVCGTVQDSGQGIDINDGVIFEVSNCNVSNCSHHGIKANSNTTINLSDCSFSNIGTFGLDNSAAILIASGGTLNISGNNTCKDAKLGLWCDGVCNGTLYGTYTGQKYGIRIKSGTISGINATVSGVNAAISNDGTIYSISGTLSSPNTIIANTGTIGYNNNHGLFVNGGVNATIQDAATGISNSGKCIVNATIQNCGTGIDNANTGQVWQKGHSITGGSIALNNRGNAVLLSTTTNGSGDGVITNSGYLTLYGSTALASADKTNISNSGTVDMKTDGAYYKELADSMYAKAKNTETAKDNAYNNLQDFVAQYGAQLTATENAIKNALNGVFYTATRQRNLFGGGYSYQTNPLTCTAIDYSNPYNVTLKDSNGNECHVNLQQVQAAISSANSRLANYSNVTDLSNANIEGLSSNGNSMMIEIDGGIYITASIDKKINTSSGISIFPGSSSSTKTTYTYTCSNAGVSEAIDLIENAPTVHTIFERYAQLDSAYQYALNQYNIYYDDYSPYANASGNSNVSTVSGGNYGVYNSGVCRMYCGTVSATTSIQQAGTFMMWDGATTNGDIYLVTGHTVDTVGKINSGDNTINPESRVAGTVLVRYVDSNDNLISDNDSKNASNNEVNGEKKKTGENIFNLSSEIADQKVVTTTAADKSEVDADYYNAGEKHKAVMSVGRGNQKTTSETLNPEVMEKNFTNGAEGTIILSCELDVSYDTSNIEEITGVDFVQYTNKGQPRDFFTEPVNSNLWKEGFSGGNSLATYGNNTSDYLTVKENSTATRHNTLNSIVNSVSEGESITSLLVPGKVYGVDNSNSSFKFLGWCLDKEGNDTIYKNVTSFPIGNDYYWYPIFDVQYDVQYNGNLADDTRTDIGGTLNYNIGDDNDTCSNDMTGFHDAGLDTFSANGDYSKETYIVGWKEAATVRGNTGKDNNIQDYFEKQVDVEDYDNKAKVYQEENNANDYSYYYSFQGWSLNKHAKYSDKSKTSWTTKVYTEGEKFTNDNVDESNWDTYCKNAIERWQFYLTAKDNGNLVTTSNPKRAVIQVYACWDEYPELWAYDRDFTSGEINNYTSETFANELLQTVNNSLKTGYYDTDREDGKNIKVSLYRYDFSQFEDIGDWSVPGSDDFGKRSVTFKVEDNAGNVSYYTIRITVISDHGTRSNDKSGRVEPIYTRFIDELNWLKNPYWNNVFDNGYKNSTDFTDAELTAYCKEYERWLQDENNLKAAIQAKSDGAMEAYSKWYIRPELVRNINETFEAMVSNDWRNFDRSYTLGINDIRYIQDYTEVHGTGETKEDGALDAIIAWGHTKKTTADRYENNDGFMFKRIKALRKVYAEMPGTIYASGYFLHVIPKTEISLWDAGLVNYY